MASSARRCDRAGAVSWRSTAKSQVPAIVVLSPSRGKRAMRRIPERPAVSAAQFAALPAPREVTRPEPVTTTVVRALIGRSSCRLDHDEAFRRASGRRW